MLPSIIKAAVNQRTPVIIQTSCGTANYIGHKNLVSVCKSMAEQYGIDVVLHLDHAKDYDEIRKAIDAGYSSVMFDGSSLPLKDNILGTKRVVEYAKKNGVSVEAELGTVGGTEDGVVVDQKDVCYTDPQDAVEFVKQTGIDALAVAIGTNHGQYKSKTNINFERLKEIKEVIDIPLVIHLGIDRSCFILQDHIVVCFSGFGQCRLFEFTQIYFIYFFSFSERFNIFHNNSLCPILLQNPCF